MAEDFGFLSDVGSSKDAFDKVVLTGVKKLLGDYALRFQVTVQKQLERAGKEDTGQLSSTITFRSIEQAGDVGIEIDMLEYYKYVDQGVRGKGPGNRNTKSPFKFNNKYPNIGAIEKWIKNNQEFQQKEDQKRKLSALQRKRRSVSALAQRTDSKTLAFLIARKIYRRGLPYTGFFERSFEQTFKDLDQRMSELLGFAVESNINIVIKEIQKES